MFAEPSATDLKRKAKVMADSKKYRTKFYLRSVSFEDGKLVAEVEPVSPYLFRIRETEYYGILKEICDNDKDKLLEGKFIPLHKFTNSFGDETRCFKFEYKLDQSNPTHLESALLGKSADAIVEIDIQNDESGQMTIIDQESSSKCFMEKLFSTINEVDHPERDCLLALLYKKYADAKTEDNGVVFKAKLISIRVG